MGSRSLAKCTTSRYLLILASSRSVRQRDRRSGARVGANTWMAKGRIQSKLSSISASGVKICGHQRLLELAYIHLFACSSPDTGPEPHHCGHHHVIGSYLESLGCRYCSCIAGNAVVRGRLDRPGWNNGLTSSRPHAWKKASWIHPAPRRIHAASAKTQLYRKTSVAVFRGHAR